MDCRQDHMPSTHTVHVTTSSDMTATYAVYSKVSAALGMWHYNHLRGRLDVGNEKDL